MPLVMQVAKVTPLPEDCCIEAQPGDVLGFFVDNPNNGVVRLSVRLIMIRPCTQGMKCGMAIFRDTHQLTQNVPIQFGHKLMRF